MQVYIRMSLFTKKAIFEIVQVGLARQYNAENKYAKHYLLLTADMLFGMLPKTTNLRFGSFRNPERNASGLMQERSYTSTAKGYRFGFQGQEGDDEVSGSGNSYAFKYRIHDAWLGSFLSVYPLAKDDPWNSSYAFAENEVIDGLELQSHEIVPSNGDINYNFSHYHSPRAKRI